MTGAKTKEAAIVGAALIAAVALGKPLWKRLRLSRVPLYKLKGHGIEVHVSALGGIVQRLFVIDAHGETDDVVLGFDNISTYLVGLKNTFLISMAADILVAFYVVDWAPIHATYS